jgi:heptosyltransferase-2
MVRSAPPDLSHVRRIFVRAPNWVGDLVMATASLRRIRAAFPHAHVALGLRPYLRPLVQVADWSDELVDTPRARGLRGLWSQVAAMRKGHYDLAIVLPNSIETALVPFLARVPLRLGYRQGRPGLLNLGLTARLRRRWFQRRLGPRRWPTPMPYYYRELLDVLGLPGAAVHPELPVTDAERQWVDQHLRERGIGPDARLLMLVVGANYGASKLWMPERFVAVARHFQDRHGMRALVLAGPAEVELGEHIAAQAGALAMTRPVLPLDRLKAVVDRGQLLITGDTGPRHIAVAFDKPIVCLIGPTDPNYTDYCMERTALIRMDLPCSPCQQKICPLGHHRCMRDITVEEVVQAGERLLGL